MSRSSDVRVYFPSDQDQLHYVYQVAYETPPDGVVYLNATEERTTRLGAATNRAVSHLRKYGAPLKHLYQRYWSGKDISKVGVETPEYDIYHSRSAARSRSEPWVQECEHVGTVLGKPWRKNLADDHHLQRAEEAFARSSCRAILPHTKAATESIRRTLPNSDLFEDKLEHVYLAYDPPGDCSPPTSDGPVRFLFVGSAYFDDQFYIKGGDKVLRAFDRIADDVNARLTVRSDVPEEFVDRYGGREDIDLVTAVVSRERIEKLYRDADVFVFPSAQGTPGAVFREAMGHACSIVGLDIWGNDELVVDGETGILVRPDESFQYVYPEYNVPVVGAGTYFQEHGERSLSDIITELTRNDGPLVDRVAAAMRRLAEDDDLRRRQAVAGRERVVDGELSLQVRNEKLGQIYRDAVVEA
jgi:glycosyltransferase involved in cell wall biosynthesis